jgi:transcriptional regulator with XRE-family HTH domain
MEFGERLGELMRLYDVTAKELARKSGVSVRYINALRAGKHSPTLDKAIKLARVLGVTLHDLAGLPPAGDARQLSGLEVALLNAYRTLPDEAQRVRAVEMVRVFAGIKPRGSS